MIPMPERLRVLLYLNGFGLIASALLSGWVWFFSLLHRIVLWPLPIHIDFALPDDPRGWRMAHMEGITQGLLLMAIAAGGPWLRHTERGHRVLFWAALTMAWLFTIPAMLHPIFGTRGLEFGGGPFKGGLANDVLYVIGWPPMIGVHVMIVMMIVGVRRYLKELEAS